MMRWIKNISLIFLVTLLLLMAGGAFTLHQQLKQAEITNLTWSLNHLDLNSLELKSISATYQQEQQIKLENVLVQWSDVDTWFDSAFEITIFSIENAQLQLSSNTVSADQAIIIEPPSEFSWHKTLAEWQTEPFVSDRFAWLGLLPKTTEIKHVSVSRDCPTGLCRLTGQLSAILENSSPSLQTQQGQQNTPFQASFQGSLANPESPENALAFQMKAALNAENLPSLQLQLSLDDKLNFTLNNHLTSENQLASTLSLSGIAPSPIWFNTLEDWTGFSLSEAALSQLQQQALTPVKIDASNNMPLTSVGLLVQQLISEDSKIANSQITENSPLTKPTELLSKLSTQFEMNIELPKPTPIPAIGLLQGVLQAKLKLQQGLLEEYQLQVIGNLSDHVLSEKLKAFGLITGLEIETIAFKLNSQRGSQKNSLTNIPFDLSLNSVTPAVHKSQLRLVSQGELSLGDNPGLTLHKAELILQQPALTIQVASDQPGYDIRNLKLDIPFTAEYQNHAFTLKAPSARIKGDLKAVDQSNKSSSMVTLNQSSLQFNRLNFNLRNDPFKPLTWSLSSKQATLKTQFTSPQLKAKDLQISLNSLQLNNSVNGVTSTPIQIKANYSASTPRLEQAQLLPQFWAAQGALSGGLNNLQFSGRISNAAELSIKHSSRWKNQTLTTDWSLEPLFFLAGNSLKKLSLLGLSNLPWPVAN